MAPLPSQHWTWYSRPLALQGERSGTVDARAATFTDETDGAQSGLKGRQTRLVSLRRRSLLSGVSMTALGFPQAAAKRNTPHGTSMGSGPVNSRLDVDRQSLEGDEETEVLPREGSAWLGGGLTLASARWTLCDFYAMRKCYLPKTSLPDTPKHTYPLTDPNR